MLVLLVGVDCGVLIQCEKIQTLLLQEGALRKVPPTASQLLRDKFLDRIEIHEIITWDRTT